MAGNAATTRRAFLMGAVVGSAALAIGLGISWPRFGAAWSRPNAVFDADFEGERFVYRGHNYATKAEFLAAIGGEEISGATSIGPYAIPGAPEKVTNGDFSDGTTGWSGFNSGTISVIDGVCRLAGNSGNIPGFSQALALAKGHAYRFRAKQRKLGLGGGFPTAAVTVAPTASLGGTNALHIPSGDVVAFVEPQSTFSASADTIFVGGRHVANPSVGSSEYDGFSVVEVLPFAGFEQRGMAAIVAGVMPATASGDKVILQASCGGLDNTTPHERNRLRLVWDSSKNLRLIVTAANTDVANLNLGVIDESTPFEVIFSAAANEFWAALPGGPAVGDLVGDLPGFAKLYLGRQNALGSTFDGTINRVTLFPHAWSEAEFYERMAEDTSIAMWGDSLTAGANVSNSIYRPPQAAALLYDPDRSVLNLGQGGQTSTQIAARMNAQPIMVTVSGDQIPTSGGVAVTARNINVLHSSGVFTGAQKGRLAGVYGTMSTDASGNWTFTRQAAGSAIPCPSGSVFTTELGERLRNRIAWLWLGRNGAQSGYTVEGDIAAAVASLGHSRYLVGSVLTASGDSAPSRATILARNATLAATLGDRFVDVFTALAEANDGSPTDLADVADSITPSSLRSDAVHLNDAGYAVVAAAFKAASDSMEAAGWP